MHEGRLSDLVEVPLWAVVMAVRYGQHRWSYASGDAVELAEEHWDRFPQFIRDQMLDDWKFGTINGTVPPDDVAARWEALRKRSEEHEIVRTDAQDALVCSCGLAFTDAALYRDHTRGAR